MRVTVVYESQFGDTRAAAEAVAEGIRRAEPFASVTVGCVAAVVPDQVAAADLLVVGAPVYWGQLSRSGSRHRAARAGRRAQATGETLTVEASADGPGVREWLDALDDAGEGRMAAAFETRRPVPFAGGAARAIAHRLSSRGYRLLAPPEAFLVQSRRGPLQPDEASRARAWGSDLVANRARHRVA